MIERFMTANVPAAPGSRIFDIGCGPGTNVEHLAAGVEYIGCDLSRRYIDFAEQKYGDRAKFFCGAVGELSTRDLGEFDFVLAIGVLHHLTDDEVRTLCKEAGHFLKHDGALISLEPCWRTDQPSMERFFTALDRGEHVRRVEEYVSLVKPVLPEVETSTMDVRDVRLPTNCCIIKARKELTALVETGHPPQDDDGR